MEEDFNRKDFPVSKDSLCDWQVTLRISWLCIMQSHSKYLLGAHACGAGDAAENKDTKTSALIELVF